MKRIYLSSLMTGLPDLNCPACATITDSLRADGQTVTNPAELNPDGGTWNDCMLRQGIRHTARQTSDSISKVDGDQSHIVASHVHFSVLGTM